MYGVVQRAWGLVICVAIYRLDLGFKSILRGFHAKKLVFQKFTFKNLCDFRINFSLIVHIALLFRLVYLICSDRDD